MFKMRVLLYVLTSNVTEHILLADVFEPFRTMSLQSYGLDPVHYYSLPALSWDAALKFSGGKLDLIDIPYCACCQIRTYSTLINRWNANNSNLPFNTKLLKIDFYKNVEMSFWSRYLKGIFCEKLQGVYWLKVLNRHFNIDVKGIFYSFIKS